MIKPVVLIILDGWGIASAGPGNAVSLAHTPFIDKYWSVYPHTLLQASGEAVGLPVGEVGNSETGHLNLGAGCIVYQDLPRINMAIANGSFFDISVFKTAITHAKLHNSALHLIGLVGAGGVHSSLLHIFALLKLAKDNNLKKVWLHVITDGRDSPPRSAGIYISNVINEIHRIGVGKIATICGRYYAMDRDYHWERTQKAYDLLVEGKGEAVSDINNAINSSYQKGISDEFFEPMIVDKRGIVKDNDALIFANFRIDRPRQLTKAIVLPDLDQEGSGKGMFDPYAEKYGLRQYYSPEIKQPLVRNTVLKNICFVTMTEYEENLPVYVAFPRQPVKMPLSRILSENSLRQLRLSETEKERFVTYYFNGQKDEKNPGEDWIEIPSPSVATYDMKPEMSAIEVTEELCNRLQSGTYEFTVVNYANPDMVGHTGVIAAGVKACETVDCCLGKVVPQILSMGGTAIITADHGNVEEMINLQNGQVNTEHSGNPVPLIIIGNQFPTDGKTLDRGILADVAPTILSIMGLNKPEDMTGRSLI